MLRLNLPEYDFKIVKKDASLKIFDECRKLFVVLTPEEWVRQNMIKFLINEKGYKKGFTAVEKAVQVNGQTQRFDAVFHNSKLEPILLLETKAPHVKLNQQAIDQVVIYNQVIKAKYMLVSNGFQHICLSQNDAKIELEKEIPFFN